MADNGAFESGWWRIKEVSCSSVGNSPYFALVWVIAERSSGLGELWLTAGLKRNMGCMQRVSKADRKPEHGMAERLSRIVKQIYSASFRKNCIC